MIVLDEPDAADAVYEPPVGVIRLLDELHPDDDRTCVRCLGPIGRKAYFDLDYVCEPCAADWERYPWRSSDGRGGGAP